MKEKINTVRKIDSIKITEGPVGFGCVEDSIKKGDSFFCNGVCVEVTGSGFLRYQIRRMIGAALDVARREDLSVDFIKYQLENPSDQQEFVRAEGSGLFLSKIFYK